jgi:hexosaminidase
VRVPRRLLVVAVLCLPVLAACTDDPKPTPTPTSAASRPNAAAAAFEQVVPAPAKVTVDPAGSFTLDGSTVIRAAGPARAIGEQLAATLRPATGFPLPVQDGEARNAISLLLDGVDPSVGSEGYQLDVAADGVTIRSNTGAGLFAGGQTLRQLLPAAIEADRPQPTAWVVPGGHILDQPRFAYRGAMLDLARHFHTPGEVKTYIDEIAQYKINHLHLHLSDDQGWRIQIDSWPQLTKKAGGRGTGTDGEGPGFLTKAQYADLTAYAAARFVTIVPEIDMPSHTNAALSSYAKLNCDGKAPKPRTDTKVGYSSLCVGKALTYRFVEDVIKELAAITPGQYLHIGGDEAQATTDADYRTFMSKVIPLVGKYGKQVMGWHEIAQADLPKRAVPQFWGTEPTAATVTAAAGHGNKILMSPANRAYLDMKYDDSTPLGFDWAGKITVKTAYDWDPATYLPGVGEKSVLGVEAPLWSETLRTLDDIESMAFPRLPAIAELGWSPRSTHDWEGFRKRLAGQGPRWQQQGINFTRVDEIPWPK